MMSFHSFQIFWSCIISFLFLLLFNSLVLNSKVLFLLDDMSCEHLAERFLGRNTSQELFSAQLTISVKIQAPDYCSIVLKHHALRESSFEKVVNGLHRNESDRAVVHRSVSCFRRVVQVAFEHLLEGFSLSMKRYFHFDEPRKILLNIQSQKVSRSAVIHRPLRSFRSYLFIGAREDDLQEVWVIQFTIFVRVEELHYKVAIGLVNVHVSVVSHEVDKVYGGDESILVSVNSAERRVRLVIYVSAQELPEDLALLLLLGDAKKHFLQSHDRSVGEGSVPDPLFCCCVPSSVCHFINSNKNIIMRNMKKSTFGITLNV